MRHNPERLAWTVLFGAFFSCLALTAMTLLGSRWWLLNAPTDQRLNMARSGTVLVTRPGEVAPEANLEEFPVGSTLVTEANSQASLTFISTGRQEVLATIQVYGNTTLHVNQADSPRFSISPNSHRIRLNLTRGRIRVSIGAQQDRSVKVEVRSAPGAVTTLETPGSNASVEATSTKTMITVRDGQAIVSANGQGLSLSKDQRAEVPPNAPPIGPLPAEQDLIGNGDFRAPLDGTWQLDIRAPVDPNESPGSAEVTIVGARRALRFTRSGANWGQAGVSQDINWDVRDAVSLRLHLELLVAQQDLWNCGQLGTECPMMLAIRYVDVGGGDREWLQGFFVNPHSNPSFGLAFCGTCPPPRGEHLLWPTAQWQPFDSENLLKVFSDAGFPAATVKSISIYGSGHTFTSLVTDIQLLVTD